MSFASDIVRYIAKREAYNKYQDFKNQDNITKSDLFTQIGKICWYILLAIPCTSIALNKNTWLGLALFFGVVSIFKIISALLSYHRSSKPIYEAIPVYKSEKRFKSGQTISHYRQKKTGNTLYTSDETSGRRSKYKAKIFVWMAVLVISIVIIFPYKHLLTQLIS